jgi:SDR family mycofactocin-dependent oxidoreductase
MGSLDGRVALVTGAARGLGRALCVRLAEEGADVVGLDLGAQVRTVDYAMSTTSGLDDTVAAVEAAGGRMLAKRADVRDLGRLREIVADATDRFGHLDIVLANAAIAPVRGATGDDEQVWRDVIDVNLTGAWNTASAAIPAMISGEHGGAIVFTSSTAGLRGLGGGTAAFNAYTASKHALVGLARTLARDLGRHGIRVNTIHPGGINTPMIANETATAFVAEHPDYANAVRPALPVGVLEPRDVADAVIWLVSDAAKYVTGVALPVDAGLAL